MIIYGINVTMKSPDKYISTDSNGNEMSWDIHPEYFSTNFPAQSRDWKPEPTACNCGKPKKPKK